MNARRILLAQFLAAFFLAVLTWIAVRHFLYWRIWWFDIPMHVLGGVWAGLCAAWLLARRGHAFSLVWCLSFAFAVGVAWEIFEYSEGIATSRYLSYPMDTAKDLAMDLFGAAAGYLLAHRMSTEKKGDGK